ncbi:Other/Haspin protein kinase [Mycena kentingensis (nom. inval.)]|nr:Other/Haspin protein kinase [Mycena kentingensis (nom. inval.)]
MLGARTSKINVYGKRKQRIVNDDDRLPRPPPSIFDGLPPPVRIPGIVSRMKKRENADPGAKVSAKSKSKSKSPAPKVLHVTKKRLSPQRKVMPQMRRLEAEGDNMTPSRRPLGVRPLNTPVKKRLSGNGSPPLRSFVSNVEIVVLDGEGTTISKERRVSQRVYAVDSDEEDVPQPKPPRRLRQLASRRIESDDESEDESVVEAEHAETISVQLEVVVEPEVLLPPSPPTTLLMPWAPQRKTPLTPPRQQQTYRDSPFPAARRPRQLTPIGGRGRGLRAPPSPPSPLSSSDGDLSLAESLSDLTDLSEVLSSGSHQRPSTDTIPTYLQPLLSECGQQALHEFSAFIATFPFDPLVSGHRDVARGFKKIGEASYSEVYGIANVVLKIVPLHDDSKRRKPAALEAEEPFASDVKDVLKEIIVTGAMGSVCDGFVKLRRTYIVRGTYPQVLLELWDEYNERNGSEGIRPDTFAVSQAYAIIVLPNGGPDLEAYTFASKGGWRQACSIFWQVAKTLGHAEQLVSFEHRDLHLGQILVKDDLDATVSRPLQAVNLNKASSSKVSKPLMDDPVHGVRATLIDLGLSRMDAGDGSGGEMVHWTPFEEEIFEGEGDYQFDIYRYMRDHNGSDWQAFNPLTNALWLHYLVTKLLKSKGLRAPVRRKSQAPTPPNAGFTDRDCYECLVDIEQWLGNCVDAVLAETSKGKARGRKKKAAQVPVETPAALLRGPLCAGEVVEYGVKKGWVRSFAQIAAAAAGRSR